MTDTLRPETANSTHDDAQPVLDPLGSGPSEAPHGSASALLRGGSWNAGAQLAPLIVNLVMTPFVIHGLGLGRFGLYILATSISDFLGTFDGGVYASSQRYFAVYAGRDDRRSASRLCATLVLVLLAIGAVMTVILFAAAPVFMSLFRVPESLRGEGEFLLRTLGLVITFEMIRGVFAAVLNARQRFSVTSLTTIAQYGIYSVGVILTVEQGWGLRGIGLTLLAQVAISTLIMGVAASKWIDRRELRLMSKPELADYWRFASRAQVAGLSDLINLQSDSMIIGGFLNVRSVALYSSGRNFASQMRALPWNAIGPAATLLGQTFGSSGADAALRQFRQLQRWWVQACTGWIAVAAGAAYFGVTSWLGAGFELSGVVAVVLLGGYLFRLWAGMLLVYCQTVGHPELEARYGAVSVVVNLALTLALVVPFGVLGVVAATAIGQLVGSLYLLYIVRARLSARIPSFLREVPWTAAAFATTVTVEFELIARPVLSEGPLGLLEAGIVAIPGLLLFAFVLLGPSGVLNLVAALRARLGGRRSNTAVPNS